jgi:hypothetical protein
MYERIVPVTGRLGGKWSGRNMRGVQGLGRQGRVENRKTNRPGYKPT